MGRASLVRGHALGFLGKLPAELLLQFRELGLDILASLALLDDFLPIAAQEVVNRFHADPDRTGRLVLVEILETKVGRA